MSWNIWEKKLPGTKCYHLVQNTENEGYLKTSLQALLYFAWISQKMAKNWVGGWVGGWVG